MWYQSKISVSPPQRYGQRFLFLSYAVDRFTLNKMIFWPPPERCAHRTGDFSYLIFHIPPSLILLIWRHKSMQDLAFCLNKRKRKIIYIVEALIPRYANYVITPLEAIFFWWYVGTEVCWIVVSVTNNSRYILVCVHKIVKMCKQHNKYNLVERKCTKRHDFSALLMYYLDFKWEPENTVVIIQRLRSVKVR